MIIGEETVYRQKDGWLNIPTNIKVRPKKTKDASLFRCPTCKMFVQLKYKVWMFTTRNTPISIAVYPQCDKCKTVMTEVDPQV